MDRTALRVEARNNLKASSRDFYREAVEAPYVACDHDRKRRDYRRVFFAAKFIERMIDGIFGAIPRVAIIKIRCGKLLLALLETERWPRVNWSSLGVCID